MATHISHSPIVVFKSYWILNCLRSRRSLTLSFKQVSLTLVSHKSSSQTWKRFFIRLKFSQACRVRLWLCTFGLPKSLWLFQIFLLVFFNLYNHRIYINRTKQREKDLNPKLSGNLPRKWEKTERKSRPRCHVKVIKNAMRIYWSSPIRYSSDRIIQPVGLL